MPTLAIDIGATKIAVAVVSPTQEVTLRREIPSSELWNGLSTALLDVARESDVELKKIGIGSAGPINTAQGTISPVNIPSWRDFPLISLIQDLFPHARTGQGSREDKEEERRLFYVALTRAEKKLFFFISPIK